MRFKVALGNRNGWVSRREEGTIRFTFKQHGPSKPPLCFSTVCKLATREAPRTPSPPPPTFAAIGAASVYLGNSLGLTGPTRQRGSCPQTNQALIELKTKPAIYGSRLNSHRSKICLVSCFNRVLKCSPLKFKNVTNVWVVPTRAQGTKVLVPHCHASFM